MPKIKSKTMPKLESLNEPAKEVSNRSPKMKKKSKPFAFVLMPFITAKPIKGGYQPLDKDKLDTIYGLIKTVISKKGYEVRRAKSPTSSMDSTKSTRKSSGNSNCLPYCAAFCRDSL